MRRREEEGRRIEEYIKMERRAAARKTEEEEKRRRADEKERIRKAAEMRYRRGEELEDDIEWWKGLPHKQWLEVNKARKEFDAKRWSYIKDSDGTFRSPESIAMRRRWDYEDLCEKREEERKENTEKKDRDRNDYFRKMKESEEYERQEKLRLERELEESTERRRGFRKLAGKS